MTDKEWEDYFELMNRRKPTADEFMNAKKQNFSIRNEEKDENEPFIQVEKQETELEDNSSEKKSENFSMADTVNFIKKLGYQTEKWTVDYFVPAHNFLNDFLKKKGRTPTADEFQLSQGIKLTDTYKVYSDQEYRENLKTVTNNNIIKNTQKQENRKVSSHQNQITNTVSSYQNRQVSSATQKASARNQAVNDFLRNHWKKLVGIVIGIVVVLFIWNAAVSQTKPDGTYHSSDLTAIIGVMSFTDSKDTLTFNSDGTVIYSGGDSMSTQFNGRNATSDNGTYSLNNGYLTINMQIAGRHTFKYSKNIFGNISLNDSTGNDFSFTKW